MDGGAGLKVRASDVAIERDCPVTLGAPVDEVRVREVLHAVGQEVGVASTPLEGGELHDGDEAAEVVHLSSRVLPVDQPREVEQLGSLQEGGREGGGESLVSPIG